MPFAWQILFCQRKKNRTCSLSYEQNDARINSAILLVLLLSDVILGFHLTFPSLAALLIYKHRSSIPSP